MTSKRKKRIVAFGLILTLLLALVIWTIWGNTALQTNEYTIKSDKISDSFDGFRIVHISDLHNAKIGKENQKLLDKISDANPDIIAITGDLVDRRHTDISVALSFTKKAVEIAPCYFVSGNHEAYIAEYDYLKSELEKQGVVVLDNGVFEIEKSGEKIALVGLKDPSFKYDHELKSATEFLKTSIKPFSLDKTFTVLLAHKPEPFDIYAECGADLVLSGHTHGGQFRLPFVGGVLSPDHTFFPEYDAGLFVKDDTSMIVSKGIGNSSVPVRFNNRPEIIVVTLQQSEN